MIDRKTQPDLHALSGINLIRPNRHVLANGTIMFTMDGCPEPVVQIEFVSPLGKKYQKKILQTTMMLEMLVEGSDGKSAHEIMNALDAYGAYIETSSGNDRVQLSLFTMSKYLKEVLDILKLIIEKPNFDESDFNILLSRHKENYLVQQEKVSVLARKAFYKNVFNGHPYGNTSTIEDFDKITVQDCKDHYDTHFLNDGCEIFVSGKLEDNHIETLKEVFGSIELNAKRPTKSGSCEFLPISGAKHIEKESVQTGLRMGKLSLKRDHRDYPGLQFLMILFGGYFGSRLMRNIREDKGFTYGIGAGVASMDEVGMMYIATEVGTEYVQDTLKEINKEVDLLKNEDVSENELELVKNYISGSFARSSDGAFEMMHLFKNAYYSELEMSYYNQYLESIKDMDAASLKKLANAYLNTEDMTIITVGKSN